MLRAATRVAVALLLAGAGFCAVVWNNRRALPYNAQEHYFDSKDAVVLHEQSVGIYGGLALLLTLLAVTLWIASRRV